MAKDSKGHGSNSKQGSYGGANPKVIEASGKARKPMHIEGSIKTRAPVVPGGGKHRPMVIPGPSLAPKKPRVIPGSLSRASKRR